MNLCASVGQVEVERADSRGEVSECTLVYVAVPLVQGSKFELVLVGHGVHVQGNGLQHLEVLLQGQGLMVTEMKISM